MFKDKIASDVRSSNLAWNDREQKAIDRITALGLTDQLGAALFRFKYGSDAAAGKRALHLLAHKSAQRLKVELSYARMLSTAAIKEWLIDACETCNGTGIVPGVGRHDKCSKCDGSGVKRHSDTERALAAGLPVGSWDKHQKRYDQVMTCMMGAIAETTGRARELLKEPA